MPTLSSLCSLLLLLLLQTCRTFARPLSLHDSRSHDLRVSRLCRHHHHHHHQHRPLQQQNQSQRHDGTQQILAKTSNAVKPLAEPIIIGSVDSVLRPGVTITEEMDFSNALMNALPTRIIQLERPVPTVEAPERKVFVTVAFHSTPEAPKSGSEESYVSVLLDRWYSSDAELRSGRPSALLPAHPYSARLVSASYTVGETGVHRNWQQLEMVVCRMSFAKEPDNRGGMQDDVKEASEELKRSEPPTELDFAKRDGSVELSKSRKVLGFGCRLGHPNSSGHHGRVN